MADATAERIAAEIAAEIGCRPRAGHRHRRASRRRGDGALRRPLPQEATGGLDDTQLRKLDERLAYLRERESRRAAVLSSIAAQGKLTADLEARLVAATTKAEIEDLYAPTSRSAAPRRRLRARRAWARSPRPSSRIGAPFPPSARPRSSANRFRTSSRPSTVLATSSSKPSPRTRLGRTSASGDAGAGRPSLRVVAGKEAAGEKFADYFDHAERWSGIPSHRALAMLRGRNEEILSLDLEIDADDPSPVKPVERVIAAAYDVPLPPKLPGDLYLADVARWAWRVKLSLHLSLDLMTTLRERAEEEAIRVFAANLKDLLLAAPAGSRATMGLDPGIRTGVKVAVVDGTGKLLDTATVYPFQPRNDVSGTLAALSALVRRHKVELIAIGNGTASRETDRLVAGMLADMPPPKPVKVVVSEAGASVYSASERAAAEFPNLDVSLRGAVSIARRLQDPLAELVKIDPKSIGVGQYQHDVDQSRLAKALDAVVEDAVNAVGVDLNTASASLLARVSGLGASLAEAIVAHRDANGPFRTRKALMEVPRLGARTFELSAGFLRIRAGDEPLDASSVHPEAYGLARRIVAACGRDLRSLMGDAKALKSLNAASFVTIASGCRPCATFSRSWRSPAAIRARNSARRALPKASRRSPI